LDDPHLFEGRGRQEQLYSGKKIVFGNFTDAWPSQIPWGPKQSHSMGSTKVV
jgi:hypothetical protein